ncbi:MMPL family transporter [Actinomyces sp. oral taxon 448]|uniref:MMPL family transporter n=1 Tax=Actinomyces sp. oral taxon 448 TaxID=712124 RepID=UPI0025BCF56B|nr:MMPL family transporter [Actinomyces sp. oral taxon 448]
MAVFVLLFCMTGSLVVLLKALIINALSLIASLGLTSWLFENGHLGLPQTPGLQTFIVACLAAFGFGLAMDYEVFLLARMTEYWEAGHDNDDSVARGLQRSGRIITSAAAIIIAVFLGFVTGEMISIKEIGVGLAIMVAADATLVRLLLVPATMTVLGRWNWWAPSPLKRLYGRVRQRN